MTATRIAGNATHQRNSFSSLSYVSKSAHTQLMPKLASDPTNDLNP